MDLPEDKRQAILDAICAGRKIEAIKLVREAANCGLKEAKEFVESYEVELRRKNPDKFASAPSGKGCFGIVLAGTGIGFGFGLGVVLVKSFYS